MVSGHPPHDDERSGEARATPERTSRAWRAWLEALATDAEAALGAALAYEALEPNARDAFLTAVDQDAGRLGVPRVALFAPLLSVERDPNRRDRIQECIGGDLGPAARSKPRALLGLAPNGDRVASVITPVYLDFVRVTSCRFAPHRGVTWVREIPLMNGKDAPQQGSRLDGVAMEAVPLRAAANEVAHAIVSQRRIQGSLPDSLRPLLDLFDSEATAAADGPESGP